MIGVFLSLRDTTDLRLVDFTQFTDLNSLLHVTQTLVLFLLYQASYEAATLRYSTAVVTN